jgi:hypothetical protein
MKTLEIKDGVRPDPAANLKLRPQPLPPLAADEAAVIDTFIRHKRVEARAKARGKDLAGTVLGILRHRKAVERRGACVSLDRRYDYRYSDAVAKLQESVKLACAMERKEGTAKADVTLAVAFEDVAAKALAKKGEAIP